MNYEYYQYLMPKNPALIAAWHARRDKEGVMHAPLLRLLLWGDSSLRMVQHVDRSTRSAIACSFRGDDADRLWREAGEAGKSVRAYITDRFCDALGIPRHDFSARRPPRGPARNPKPRVKEAAAVVQAKVYRVPPRARGNASPTQPAGGPYWPNRWCA